MVVIGQDRLAVVLAYLADKEPEDVRQRREWTRCMAILSAQRKEAPDAAAGKCGGCELRGQCDEDTLPGGCPKQVGIVTSTPPPHFDPATVALPSFLTTEALERCGRNIAKSGIPATVAFPFVTRKELAEAIEGIRDSIAKAMRSHERVRHDPTPEHQTRPTCHHHAVCGHVNDNGCASWEGQPLDDMPGA
jgi:hypothetical protein